jgi:hypothetical protein
MPARRTVVTATFAIVLSIVPSIGVVAGGACDPIDTAPVFAGDVPTANDVLGFDLGSQEVTTDEAWTYLDAVDAASDRVVGDTYATSVDGRPLRYAVVGRPANVTPGGLDDIRQAVLTIRDPSTPDDEVATLAATTPAILYIGGNVHGSEESGTDAALQVLYELADRTDCAAQQILDHAVVFVLPIMNPDGREDDTRRNAYGVDMNRDGLMRSQPEIDGRTELLRQFPPQLFVDAHEFGYTRSFFPPNSDPIYHEDSSQVFDQVSNTYGTVLADLFEERDWGYFNGGGYDYFAPIYGDTVPAFGFEAAGITLEQNNGAPIDVRVEKYHDEFWVLLSAGALDAEGILTAQHEAYVDAVAEGEAGTLEPNGVYYDDRPLLQEVPNERIRSYFFWGADDQDREVQMLVRMLQRMDVQVYRLNAHVDVEKFRSYTDVVGPKTIPKRAYWVPMAQPQKHWIQVALNRDTYVPVKQTYDVTGWSLPLLMNLRGGSTGNVLSPDATLADPADVPPAFDPPADPPTVGILKLSHGVYMFEAVRQLEYLFDNAFLQPYTEVRSEDVADGALHGLDVLVVPGSGIKAGLERLGPKGITKLKAWVRNGGRFVGYRYGGGLLADRIGMMDTTIVNSPTYGEGLLVKIRVDPTSHLFDGMGSKVWVLFDNDDIVRHAPTGAEVAWYTKPVVTSGLMTDYDRAIVEGTPAILDDSYGDGRVIVFPFDPNYRLYTIGMERVIWNAIFGP